jgi:hypothetical protein
MTAEAIISQEQRPLSQGEKSAWKSLRGRLKTSLDQSTLMLMGGRNSGLTINAGIINNSLSPSVMKPTSFPLTPDAVDRASVFADVLLGNKGKQPKANYTKGIGENDIANLPQTAVNFGVDGANKSGIVFRIVHGASEEVPLRSLTSALPALQMMDAMFQEGVTPPELQIVLANNISSAINDLSSEKVAKQAQLFAAAQQLYISHFFPHLQESVVLLEDAPFVEKSVVAQSLQSTARALDKINGRTLDKLSQKGAADMPADKKRMYGAAHPLFHDAIPKGLLIPLVDGQRDYVVPQTIISMGGTQEVDFYDIRSQVRELVDSSFPLVNTLQLFTRHGVPPYYMANGGDVSLSSIAGNSEIADVAEHDLRYLQRVSASRGDFHGFIDNLRERMAA